MWAKTNLGLVTLAVFLFFRQNCTSNIVAVGISNEVSTSELTKIALGSPDRVLRVASTFDLEEETITKIEDMIEEGPIIPTTPG